jgi:hypothetical protein
MTSGQRLQLLFGRLGRSIKPGLIVLLESLQLFGVTGCQRTRRLFVVFCRLLLRSIGFLLEPLELFLVTTLSFFSGSVVLFTDVGEALRMLDVLRGKKIVVLALLIFACVGYPLLVKLLDTSQYRSRTMQTGTYAKTAQLLNMVFPSFIQCLVGLVSKTRNLICMIQCGVVFGTVVV